MSRRLRGEIVLVADLLRPGSCLKQLDDRRMARSNSETSVTRNQWSAEFFSKYNVGRIISRKVVAQLPNPGQQHKMGIPCNLQVKQVLNCLIGALLWNGSFPHQAPQDLDDLNIQK